MRGAAGQQHRLHRDPDRRHRHHGQGLVRRGRWGERLDRGAPGRSRRGLRRQLRRPHHPVRSPHGADAGGQRLARQPDGLGGGGPEVPLPVDVPDRAVPARPERPVHRRAGSVQVRERGADLADRQRRPDAQRKEQAGSLGRPHHQGQHQRRVLQHHLHGRAEPEGLERDLGRHRRRVGAGDPRRRQDLAERHAERPARVGAREHGRGVPPRSRDGLRRGDPLQARRLPAVRLQDERLRALVEEARRGDPGEPLRSRGARGPDPPRAPVRGWRIRHLRVLRRRGELAVAPAQPAGRPDPRPDGQGSRPRGGHPRARLLGARRHRPARAARRRSGPRRAAPLHAARRGAVPRAGLRAAAEPRRHRREPAQRGDRVFLPEGQARRRGDPRHPRRPGFARAPLLHPPEGSGRFAQGGGGAESLRLGSSLSRRPPLQGARLLGREHTWSPRGPRAL